MISAYHLDQARQVIAQADVWEQTLPWTPRYWDINVLRRYWEAGFNFVSLTLQDWPPTFEGMRDAVDRFAATIEDEASWLTFGSSLEDIDVGRAAGKLVLGLNSQETRPIGEDLSRIKGLHQLGVRHMLLAYNVRNLVADGCAERADAGLSNFGRHVIAEMNRVGIVVDCTHTGRKSSLEAMELTQTPPIFSHSNPSRLRSHMRNIDDDQIRMCAARGGVVGLVGVGEFLGDPAAAAETYFAQIEYVATLVGPEHVGLGTDYVDIFPAREHPERWAAIRAEAKPPWPDPKFGWTTDAGTQVSYEDARCFAPEQLRELVAIMLARGWCRQDVIGFLGGNFRRVYGAAEAFASDAS